MRHLAVRGAGGGERQHTAPSYIPTETRSCSLPALAAPAESARNKDGWARGSARDGVGGAPGRRWRAVCRGRVRIKLLISVGVLSANQNLVSPSMEARGSRRCAGWGGHAAAGDHAKKIMPKSSFTLMSRSRTWFEFGSAIIFRDRNKVSRIWIRIWIEKYYYW
jgi:hypothetical protein